MNLYELQALKTMGKDTQIIILEDILPIKANKIIYYADKTFTSKLMPKSHVPKIEMQAVWLGVRVRCG
jgi:type IV secretory pathway TraG/TraD family ATPase VirD4